MSTPPRKGEKRLTSLETEAIPLSQEQALGWASFLYDRWQERKNALPKKKDGQQ